MDEQQWCGSDPEEELNYLRQRVRRLERIEAERDDLREAVCSYEHKLQIALRGGELALWEWNVVSGEVTFNEQWAEIMECSPEELEPDAPLWRERVHPEDLDRVMKVVDAHLHGESDYIETEFRIRTHKNDWKWILTRAEVQERGVDGKAVRVLGTHRDVTHRKMVDDVITKAKREWEQTVDSIEDLIMILDDENRIVRLNRAMARRLGLTPQEAVGLSCFKSLEGACGQLSDWPNPQVLKEGKGYTTEVYDESLGRVFDVRVSPFQDSETRLARSVYVARDITDQKFVRIARRPESPDTDVSLEEKARRIAEDTRVIKSVYVARDITTRKLAEQELAQSLEQLEKVSDQITIALSHVVDKRDPYTAGHQRRVAQLAAEIAEEMGVWNQTAAGIRVAGILHDIGKINVPAEILAKPGQLTDLEFAMIKMHPQIGYEILKDIDFPWPVAETVLQHHERLDGSGYPHGLAGSDILLEARIIAVADVVEAMEANRPYRPALADGHAKEEIIRNRGKLYDADAVDACLRLMERGLSLK